MRTEGHSVPHMCWEFRVEEWGWDRTDMDNSRVCKETAEPVRGRGGVG